MSYERSIPGAAAPILSGEGPFLGGGVRAYRAEAQGCRPGPGPTWAKPREGFCWCCGGGVGGLDAAIADGLCALCRIYAERELALEEYLDTIL